jgi:hypothetical protein
MATSGADRYSAILPVAVRERLLFQLPRAWDELELQAHWFAGDFGREFVTTAGVPVRIVQFGVWNHEAGPDFSHAAISLEGAEPIAGAIELDPDARDWERHEHAQNPAYENVVLHVFTRISGPEFFTRTASHRLVPQVLLDPSRLGTEPPLSLPEAKLGRCAAPLAEMPLDRAREVLLGAAEYRLRRKAAALARLSEAHGPDEALYQAVAEALGYKSNKLPFTLLAQRLPLRLLTAAPEEAESLLFGLSGFLPDRHLADFDDPTREYVRTLWSRWWQRRAEFARLTLGPGDWQMSGQRPVNHPQRRLAALAQTVARWKTLQRLAARGEITPLEEFFSGLSHPYWDRHYTLTSKASAKPMALVGESRVTEILLNVFLPLFAHRDTSHLATFRKLRSAQASRRAEVAATRLFGGHAARHELLKSAAIQQGLLQVYEDFCLQDTSDCAHCLFPRQLLQW